MSHIVKRFLQIKYRRVPKKKNCVLLASQNPGLFKHSNIIHSNITFLH